MRACLDIGLSPVAELNVNRSYLFTVKNGQENNNRNSCTKQQGKYRSKVFLKNQVKDSSIKVTTAQEKKNKTVIPDPGSITR
jgi:hypothetical protein